MVLQLPFRLWPEQVFRPSEVPYLLIVIVVPFILLVIYNILAARNRHFRLALQKYGLSRRLTSAELTVLNHFYDTLLASEKEQILFNHDEFRTRLLQYLTDSPQVSEKEKVEIMEKLFFQTEKRLEVNQLRDLLEGEICSLELEGQPHLATISRVREDFTILTVHHTKMKAAFQSLPSTIYAYRPRIGGYTIPVRIAGVARNALAVKQEGEIEFRSDENLIANAVINVAFTAWPHPTMENMAHQEPYLPESESPGIDNAMDLKAVEEQILPDEAILYGHTIKLAERAILVELEYDSTLHYDRKQLYWELTMDIPGEEAFVCRGTFFPSPGSRDRFLFRFTDMTEVQRVQLFQLIKKNQPHRGFLV